MQGCWFHQRYFIHNVCIRPESQRLRSGNSFQAFQDVIPTKLLEESTVLTVCAQHRAILLAGHARRGAVRPCMPYKTVELSRKLRFLFAPVHT